MGNAAVMGIVPRFRYILLSDLLLETMSDEQIEAVFAHEVGHVVHRHLLWLVASLAGLMFVVCGPGQWIADGMELLAKNHPWLTETSQAIFLMGLALAVYAMVFGYVSRRLERQADVFAARTIETDFLAGMGAGEEMLLPAATGGDALGATAVLAAPRSVGARGSSFVGEHGAATFCSALERVASVNNIPVAARSWCHGSIAKRMRFISELGIDRGKTRGFDRSMKRLYVGMSACILGLGVWTALVML
jgi:STE24 endopeptidase